MIHRLAVWVRLGSIALCLLAPACSAVVSPDIARLGGDTGSTGMHDASVPPDAGVPADDAWVPPGVDSGGACGTGERRCGGTCVSIATDPNHCGGCGILCTGGATCVSGVCGGGAGTSPLGNPADCGATHATCGDLEVCFMGACFCRPPYMNAGGACVNFATDPANCGALGRDCGGGVCVGGNCASNCPGTTGIRDCSGACVQTRNDPGNCGGCGTLCSGSQVCVNGGCHDVTVPASCTTCPCAACVRAQCCHWTSLNATACVSGITSCG